VLHNATFGRCRAALLFVKRANMTLDVEAALVRAVAPSDRADAISGDLHERRAALALAVGDAKALTICRGDVLRSLRSLLAYNVSRALADNWAFALAWAAGTCALCVATIPLWGHIGMGGTGYHLLRLAIIGLVLGCIPRASTLSCFFLLLLIGISDWAIDARETANYWYALTDARIHFLLLQDGLSMASMLILLRLVKSIRTRASRS
jgi:hypothetical protein